MKLRYLAGSLAAEISAVFVEGSLGEVPCACCQHSYSSWEATGCRPSSMMNGRQEETDLDAAIDRREDEIQGR
jgi:hypothetical protein